MLITDATTNQIRTEIGIQTGRFRLTCSQTHLSEVISIRKLTPAPAAPDYILGLVPINGTICSVIDAETWILKDQNQSSTPEAPQSRRRADLIGLVLKHPHYYPFVLAGASAVSIGQTNYQDWMPLALPSTLSRISESPSILAYYRQLHSDL
ncbi:hypothetical protein [Coraliomargarita akajimensis]|uniref:Putative CheW protein n=1 Tax=Coraliomargarita akajimensis (strain DSM 45221 / IAM 15411 / JCM 23193 / KCTC 12865 / 04OKA010-24) TaxID=583355 RepID=D5ELM9_CORAD|nr:hypothetical protein [Coraliomargarita akajimensis]ADE53204.1 putative CheW protein [Coraliomargarita akajimensis DSM 45221]